MKKLLLGSLVGTALLSTLALTGCTSGTTINPTATVTVTASPSASADATAPSDSATSGAETDNSAVFPDGSKYTAPTNKPVTGDAAKKELQTYVDDYTKYVACAQGTACVANVGSFNVNCNTEAKPYTGAVLLGYTIEFSDTAKTKPTAVNCSYGAYGNPFSN